DARNLQPKLKRVAVHDRQPRTLAVRPRGELERRVGGEVAMLLPAAHEAGIGDVRKGFRAKLQAQMAWPCRKAPPRLAWRAQEHPGRRKVGGVERVASRQCGPWCIGQFWPKFFEENTGI